MTGRQNTVRLTGSDLTLADVLAVARGGARVEIDPAALAAMGASRAVVDRSIAAGTPAYGVTTGVGSRKVFDVEAPGHDRLLVRQHRISQGKPVAPEVVRASALRLANALARATTVARPELAEHLVAALNDDRLPELKTLGSIGQSDLAQMADLADGFLGEFELVPGEAIALLNQSAFATGYAALAFADALVLLDVFDHAGALDLEALGANRNSVHPAIGVARPYPGLQATLARLGTLLEGSEVEARDLQDPLTFRTIAQQNGAARDAFGFVERQLSIELNAAQSNPLVLVDEGRVISVGNFEMQPLATAIDLARLALAPVISTAAERAVKLLQRNLTGLTEGLGARPQMPESALSEFGIAIQSIAVEARLLAQPVSFDLVSTTQAEGIEDRMTSAPLAARRLEEMVELGARVAAIELMLAAQACDLRGARLGVGTAQAARCGARASSRSSTRETRSRTSSRSSRRSGPAGSVPDDGRLRRPPAPLAASLQRRARAARHGTVPGRRAPPTSTRATTDSTSPTTSSSSGSHCSTARGSRRRSSRCSRRSASRRSTPASGSSSRQRGRKASSSWRPRAGAGSSRSPSAGRGRGSWASRSAPTGSTISTRSRRRSTRCAAARLPVRPPGLLFRAAAWAPDWWPAVVDYTSQMQRAYLAWLAHGQERWPDVDVVFAILAGGGPIQLERLASRGVDVGRRCTGTSSSTPPPMAAARSSSASRHSASSSSSSAPMRPSSIRHAAAALTGFGESVERLVRLDNLLRLLA